MTLTFGGGTAVAGAGTTVRIPTSVWHEANCSSGGRLITVFTPSGFEESPAQLARLDDAALADATLDTLTTNEVDPLWRTSRDSGPGLGRSCWWGVSNCAGKIWPNRLVTATRAPKGFEEVEDRELGLST